MPIDREEWDKQKKNQWELHKQRTDLESKIEKFLKNNIIESFNLKEITENVYEPTSNENVTIARFFKVDFALSCMLKRGILHVKIIDSDAYYVIH